IAADGFDFLVAPPGIAVVRTGLRRSSSACSQYYFLTRLTRGQNRARRLQDYAVSNRVAEMGGDLSRLAHTHPNQVRVARLSMSQNPLCSIPEIDYELSR